MKTSRTPKKYPTTIFDKTQPTCQKNQQIIRPHLNFDPKIKKYSTKQIISLMLFSITVDKPRQKLSNFFTKFSTIFKFLLFFFIETFEPLIILSIIFCNLFSSFLFPILNIPPTLPNPWPHPQVRIHKIYLNDTNYFQSNRYFSFIHQFSYIFNLPHHDNVQMYRKTIVTFALATILLILFIEEL